MTQLRIDTGQLPTQEWAIDASGLLRPNISEAITTSKRVSAESLSAADTRVHAFPTTSLEDRLHGNAAELKTALSQIVMHIPLKWHEILNRQVDALLDLNRWEEESTFINGTTFTTFLRFIIYVSPTKVPSIGVSPTGDILAAWVVNSQRITVHFLPNDKATASLVREGLRGNELVTWRGHIADLPLFIDRLDMGSCIGMEPS